MQQRPMLPQIPSSPVLPHAGNALNTTTTTNQASPEVLSEEQVKNLTAGLVSNQKDLVVPSRAARNSANKTPGRRSYSPKRASVTAKGAASANITPQDSPINNESKLSIQNLNNIVNNSSFVGYQDASMMSAPQPNNTFKPPMLRDTHFGQDLHQQIDPNPLAGLFPTSPQNQFSNQPQSSFFFPPGGKFGSSPRVASTKSPPMKRYPVNPPAQMTHPAVSSTGSQANSQGNKPFLKDFTDHSSPFDSSPKSLMLNSNKNNGQKETPFFGGGNNPTNQLNQFNRNSVMPTNPLLLSLKSSNGKR